MKNKNKNNKKNKNKKKNEKKKGTRFPPFDNHTTYKCPAPGQPPCTSVGNVVEILREEDEEEEQHQQEEAAEEEEEEGNRATGPAGGHAGSSNDCTSNRIQPSPFS